jgi:NRPS condensation-like uncharacterized protein
MPGIRGVTIGDVLATGFYRTLFEAIDPPENVPLPLFVTVNLRKYIPGGVGEGVCMLSTAFIPEVSRKNSESFEGTLARVHAAMQTEKGKQKELGSMFLMELGLAPGNIFPRILGSSISSISVMPTVSNMGIIEAGAVDFEDAKVQEILPLGPMSSPPFFSIGSSTYNGEMVLNSIILGTDAYRTKVSNFFDALVKELPECDRADDMEDALCPNSIGDDPLQG